MAFFLMIRRPPIPTLVHYSTPSRSRCLTQVGSVSGSPSTRAKRCWAASPKTESAQAPPTTIPHHGRSGHDRSEYNKGGVQFTYNGLSQGIVMNSLALNDAVLSVPEP